MKKYRAYIDGFNVYHGLDNFIKDNNLHKSFSWINPRLVANHFIDKQVETLDKVYFFSAIPSQKDKNKQGRHKLYYEALKDHCDVEIINGSFQQKKKQVTCPKTQGDVEKALITKDTKKNKPMCL